MEQLEIQAKTLTIPKNAIGSLQRYAEKVAVVEEQSRAAPPSIVDTSGHVVVCIDASGLVSYLTGSHHSHIAIKERRDIDISAWLNDTIGRQATASVVRQTIEYVARYLAAFSVAPFDTQAASAWGNLSQATLAVSRKKQIKSTAASLLKHAKGWAGSDLDERLEEVSRTRSQTTF